MVLEIPAISAAVLALAWVSGGKPLPPMLVIRMTTVFVGLPALITAIGIGRLAASERLRRGRNGSIARAALVHGLAGILLTLIAALPHAAMPTTVASWSALIAMGALAGAICGAGIGVVCTGSTPRQVSEVLSLVTRPGVTLRQIIDSEDLGRIGAAVRQRASLMFDGLLDPAAPRPTSQPDDGDEGVAAPAVPASEPAAAAPAVPASEPAATEPAPAAPVASAEPEPAAQVAANGALGDDVVRVAADEPRA
jgi:hypothetical protein